MKPPFSLLAIVLAFSSVLLRADPVLRPNDFVAICGDSITEQRQYSVFMEDYFLMCQPVGELHCAQFGWNGERATGFLTRIETDVFPFKPTVATLCYGMNDGEYAPMKPETGDTYRKALTDSVEKLKAGGVRSIVVGSPGCVDSTTFKRDISAEEYNKTLDALRGIAQEVARKENVVFADVYTPMMDVMARSKAAYGASYPFAGNDGIHPGPNGHLVMAYAFLKSLGCDGNIGTIMVNFGDNTAKATLGQKILSYRNGAVEVESSRYPFCFQGTPGKAEPTSASVLRFFPFNDDLNRYLLVVKGLKGSKAKVTWGSTTKEFAAADLEKGINLAAEFLDNPFCDQFFKVQTAVQQQQSDEIVLVKMFLHFEPLFKMMAPNSASDLGKITADGLARDKELFSAAAALVTPVHHTINIEPEP